jgi:OmpA-OmpF porin, OOP family
VKKNTNRIGLLLIIFCFVINLYAQNTYEIINLGNQINSEISELNPIISADGKILYFIRSAKNELGDSSGGQDIWMSEKGEDGTWQPAVKMGSQLNRQQYNTVFQVSAAGDRMLIGGAYKDGVYWGPGFSFIDKKNGEWGEPRELEIKKFDKLFNGLYSSAFMLPDNKTLLLSFSEIEDNKSNDLYISYLLKNSKWSEPKPCGSLNTTYDESTPFMAADGVTLYFSSNRPGGFGQNDIYLTKRLDDTWLNWSEPVNLGPQINTEQWDAYYTIPASGNIAYMVSYQNTLGKADIVEITLTKQTKPQPVALISGKVINAKNNQKVEAQIIYEELLSGAVAGKTSFWSNSGDYKIVLPYGKHYGVSARAAGYIPVSINIDLTNTGDYKELERNLALVPIETGQIIRLNNIFFDEYSATLKEISLPELNRLVKLLKDNPHMQIEISGHTDAVGSDEENQILSDKRAASVKNYLIEKGVKAIRLTSIGYGETQPVADNNNEQDRPLNRRVEFKITKNN